MTKAHNDIKILQSLSAANSLKFEMKEPVLHIYLIRCQLLRSSSVKKRYTVKLTVTEMEATFPGLDPKTVDVLS